MGTTVSPSGTADALFGRVRQRILGLLLANPDRSFYAREVIRLVDSGSGAVQRELARLAGVGLVEVSRIGNQKHYRANRDSPVFEDLRGLILKTSGLADVLAEALAPIEGAIRAAFVFGSVASGEDRSGSDVDLMVVSDDLRYPDLFAVLEEVSSRLGRRVNPRIHTSTELASRIAAGHGFTTRVMAEPKIWIIGGPDELTA